MNKQDLAFRPELLRKSISYCVREDCSAKGQCLHYLAFDYDKDFVEAYFINPRKVQGNAQCTKFLSNEVKRVGRGFRRALELVPRGQSKKFRQDIMSIFQCGQTQFYNYANGLKWLTPNEEKMLSSIFAKYGVKTKEVCDTYEEAYCLT